MVNEKSLQIHIARKKVCQLKSLTEHLHFWNTFRTWQTLAKNAAELNVIVYRMQYELKITRRVLITFYSFSFEISCVCNC